MNPLDIRLNGTIGGPYPFRQFELTEVEAALNMALSTVTRTGNHYGRALRILEFCRDCHLSVSDVHVEMHRDWHWNKRPDIHRHSKPAARQIGSLTPTWGRYTAEIWWVVAGNARHG